MLVVRGQDLVASAEVQPGEDLAQGIRGAVRDDDLVGVAAEPGSDRPADLRERAGDGVAGGRRRQRSARAAGVHVQQAPVGFEGVPARSATVSMAGRRSDASGSIRRGLLTPCTRRRLRAAKAAEDDAERHVERRSRCEPSSKLAGSGLPSEKRSSRKPPWRIASK